MTVKRSRIWIYIMIAAGLFLASSAPAEIMERIVAVVNGEVITLSELNATFEPVMKRIEEGYKGPDKDKVILENKTLLLNKMIENMLIDQESKKSHIIVKDEEVNETINDFLTRRKLKMDDLINELAKDGSTLEAHKKEVKGHLLRNRLLRREIRSKVAVTEEEIGDYYRKNIESYEGKEAVRIKQILILFPKGADETAKAKIREQMEAIHKRLIAGEQFEIVGVSVSNDQGPFRATASDLGFIEKGSMLPAVESVAFGLKTGEISKVIESPVGLHILVAADRRGAGIKPIESVREEIKAKLEEEKMEKKYDEWMNDLRKKSLIEIKL
ncbi:MAG TPA: peptidylprolyl isomerase [Syntrophales bacterium]|nr:peptidylprolyl isomerase [Syntrophales bacterium]